MSDPRGEIVGFALPARRHHRASFRRRLSSLFALTFLTSALAALALGVCGLLDEVAAQTCTVSGNPTTVTLTSGSCTIAPNTTLNGSPAVHASTSAQITTNNVNINPFNGGSIGGLADTNGMITFSNGSVIQGNWSTAASAQTGGQIIFQPGSTISPSFGGGGTALVANGANSQITATGLIVNMNGGGGNTGGAATAGGLITLNGGTTISFAQGGGGNTGLRASGTGSQIVTNNAIVTMPGGGGGDTGVRSDTGANITLTGGSVTVQSNGGGETGLLASGSGSNITATNVAVSVSNSGGGRGAFLQNGASMTLNGGSVTTSGPGTFGFLFQAPSGVLNTLTINGTNVSSAADAFAVQGGIANIATTNATAIGNNGILLSASQSAAVTMTNNHSVLTGAILTDSTSTNNVTLSGATIWNMTGDSNATSVANNDSVINVTPPASPGAFKTLTVMNYTGSNGGIVFNTFLGADNSPSDRLIINGGAATGTTRLAIQNAAGPGAQTVANGILVVNTINGGTTVPGAFSLGVPVVAGPYEYLLHRGSVDGSNPQAWFLRSTFDCSQPGAPSPPCPGPGPGPGPGPTPPDFRIETSLYAAIPSLALLYGRNLLNSLHERVGEKEDQRSATGLNEYGYRAEGWGRFIGLHGQHDGDGLGVFGSGPDFRYDFLGVQAGRDFYRRESPDGTRDQAGLYFAYGTATSRITHFDGNTGDDNFTGYTLGGYWTHFGAPGWYIDAVAQGTYYDVHSTANRGIPELTTHGLGFGGSLEGGYPLHFAGGYFIEPQAQLVYQHVDLSNSSDIGASVRFDDVDSLAGRIGARFGRTWALEGGPNPRLITAWLRPNFWYEFLGDPKTQFSSADGFIPFRADLGGPWFEINAGVSGQIDKRADLFANVSYQTKFNDNNYAIAGKVGVRMLW